jgi:hypothetical protein
LILTALRKLFLACSYVNVESVESRLEFEAPAESGSMDEGFEIPPPNPTLPPVSVSKKKPDIPSLNS